METTLRGERQAARLDPFFFPSDTGFRFVLLAIAVLGASLFTYNLIWNLLDGNAARYAAQATACLQAPESSIATLPQRIAAGEVVEPAGRCMAAVNRSIVGLGAAGGLLVFALAGLGYWVLPAWRLRRGRLRPLTEEDDPEIAAALRALAAVAGLRRPPTFVWNPLALGGTPLAFGNLRRRYVFLPTGLVQEFYGDRALFRAVVLHELAHLRNADVDRTFFSIFLWRAFVAAAVLPYLVLGVSGLTAGEAVSLGWRVLALAALILLVRNGVLRAREVYADVRVSSWEGEPGALERALAADPDAPRRAGWRRLLDTHPDPAARRAALRDTRPLFRMSAWDAAATGAVVALAMPHVFRAISMVELTGLAVTGVLATALLLAPLVVGVLGTGVWRAELAARLEGEAAPRVEPLADGFAAGIGAGSAISFASWTSFADRPELVVAGLVLWSVLVALTLRSLLRWVAEGAGIWLDVAARSASPRAVVVSGLVLATGVTTVWLGLAILAHPTEGLALTLLIPGLAGALLAPLLAAVALPVLLPVSLLLLVCVGLWLYALLPLALRDRVPRPARWDWAVLGGGAPRVTPAVQASSVRMAVRAAAAAAALFAVLTVAVRLWFRLGVEWPADREALLVAGILAATAAVLQAGVARRVARRAVSLPAATALFAAFAGGVLMLSVFHLVNLLLFQGGIDAAFLRTSAQMFLAPGTSLALLALVRARRRPPEAASAS